MRHLKIHSTGKPNGGISHESRGNSFSSLRLAALVCFLLIISGCHPVPLEQGLITCSIIVDGNFIPVDVPAGSSVQQVLDRSSIVLGSLDRVDPPTYSAVTSNVQITVTRVQENFEITEEIIPFSHQTIRNESIPQGQSILAQAGINGVQQITYRRILENGVEISRVEVKRTTLQEARPEIIMFGVQTAFAPVQITNRLAYLTAGNAWIMENDSATRKPLVLTGDLDGRIFSLSDDSQWLLFSRKSIKPLHEQINSLWIINTQQNNAAPIDLNIQNVVHFADWMPGSGYSIYYSTVEPRITSPGWQANNNLLSLSLSRTGEPGKRVELLSSNSGGVYGWWGTDFYWIQDGGRLAYSRSDSIGWVDIKNQSFEQVIKILPYQTQSNWAWTPTLSFSPDGTILYTVNHIAQPGAFSEEASPIFDLVAYDIRSGSIFSLAPAAGMFAYPAASPQKLDRHFVAYLQAINAEQSETSRYRLMIMDQDGSNRKVLFPSETASGLEAQKLIWSPQTGQDDERCIAIYYQGNLWLVFPESGKSQQITGDGLISRFDWK